jgi:hypothetical protein
MRVVKFVESLNIREVRLVEGEDLRYQYQENLAPISGCNAFIVGQDVKTRIVPIHHTVKKSFDVGDDTQCAFIDKFVAYSDEVQDFLELPFDHLKATVESLDRVVIRYRDDNNKLRSKIREMSQANFWNRLKFLFSRKM